jgi:hypothetical protein
MARDLGLDEIIDHFTLDGEEAGWLRNKTGATRLGFAVQLKSLLWHGRFSRMRLELPHFQGSRACPVMTLAVACTFERVTQPSTWEALQRDLRKRAGGGASNMRAPGPHPDPEPEPPPARPAGVRDPLQPPSAAPNPGQAAPLRPLPGPINIPLHNRHLEVRRRDRLDGTPHEYRHAA